jgi:hypothetical protein
LLALDAVDVPLALTAAIVNVYAWLEANEPVTVNGVETPETDKEIDGLEVTVYEVIEEPPVAPAVKGIETVVLFVLVTVPMVGACGIEEGVVAADADDAAEVPLALVAVTVYVRATPTVSETAIGLVAPVAVLPEEEVAVNVDTAAPPVAPAVNGTDTFADPVYA